MIQHFLGKQNEYRLCCIHTNGSDFCAGMIICPPIFEESQDSKRALYNFAEEMANRGLCVIRIDYRGIGDSSGDFSQVTFDSIYEDINLAIDFIKTEYKPKLLSLMGLRYGADFVGAIKSDDLDMKILWAPLIDGPKYTVNLLRANLTTQMVIHKKVMEDRKKLINRLESGETVCIDGYNLSETLFSQINEANLAANFSKAKRNLIINTIQSESSKSILFDKFRESINHESGIQFEDVVAPKFWNLIPLYAVRPKDMFDKTANWIEESIIELSQ